MESQEKSAHIPDLPSPLTNVWIRSHTFVRVILSSALHQRVLRSNEMTKVIVTGIWKQRGIFLHSWAIGLSGKE